jgi:hypothetical protein
MKLNDLSRRNLLSLAGLGLFVFLAFGSADPNTNKPAATGGSGGGATTTNDANTSAPAADPKEVALRDIKLDYKWGTGGFGSVMEADFTIQNPTPYRVKDIEVTCTHYANSGTEIDSNTRTIYEAIEPKSKKVIKKFNMGFIHSQAAKSSCKITDLVVE